MKVNYKVIISLSKLVAYYTSYPVQDIIRSYNKFCKNAKYFVVTRIEKDNILVSPVYEENINEYLERAFWIPKFCTIPYEKQLFINLRYYV